MSRETSTTLSTQTSIGEGTDRLYDIQDIIGSVGQDTLVGDDGVNSLRGGADNDLLIGGLGADILMGEDGNDTMLGGLGNDIYYVENAGDVITEKLNEGTDVVNSSITYSLSANVENLTLTGTTAINGIGNNLNNTITGNESNNILTGNAGNDVLNGGIGIDTMLGGIGNDTYYVDNVGDVGAKEKRCLVWHRQSTEKIK